MMHEMDVVVIGGGVVGLSAAIAMKQRYDSVALLDAKSFDLDMSAPDLRVYALNRASYQRLNQLNVWPKLDASRLSPYQKMHVWDASSKGHIDFDAKFMQTDRLGTIVQESVLKQALLQQAIAEGVTLCPNSPVTGLNTALPKALIHSDQQTWQAQLIIIADGADSKTRALLNIPVTTWPYHQNAIIAQVETEKSHQKTAYQVFHPHGPLAFLPLADPHQSSIVWSSSTAHANRLMALDDTLFQRELMQAFEEKLGDVRITSERRQFPLHVRHTTHYRGSNWILMGDAAHTIHPLAGLGLNIGLADLTAWLSLLDERPTLSSTRLMNAYQRQRKHAVWQYILLMGGLKTLFSNPLPPVAIIRGLGLNACNQMSMIKRFFMEQAAG